MDYEENFVVIENSLPSQNIRNARVLINKIRTRKYLCQVLRYKSQLPNLENLNSRNNLQVPKETKNIVDEHKATGLEKLLNDIFNTFATIDESDAGINLVEKMSVFKFSYNLLQ